MAARVASLMIDIAADVASIRKDFDAAGKIVQGFGKTVETVGYALKGFIAGLSVQEVVAFGERILKAVDAMDDLAENLGIPTQDFQALQNAALLAGQSVESTSGAIQKFTVFLGQAGEGSKDQIERLNELGIKILDVNGKMRPTADILAELSTKLIAMGDNTKRAANEVAFFGRAGQSVSAIEKEWAKGTEDLNKELSAMGLQHAPATIAAIGEMEKKSAIAAQQIDVLFGYFYAMAKSNVLQSIAASFNSIATSWKEIGEGKNTLTNIGNLVALLTPLGALKQVGAMASSVAGDLGLGPLTDPQVLRNLQQTTDEFLKLQGGLDAFKTQWGENSIATKDYLTQLEKVGKKADALAKQASERGLLPIVPTDPKTGKGGASNPAVKATGGTDKYAEALRKIANETEALTAAQTAYNDAFTKGLPTAAAERLAKNLEDIAKKQNELGKGLTPTQADDIDKRVAALGKEQFAFAERKRVQQEGDAISRQYGDGQKELTDRVYALDEALKNHTITQAEYNNALTEANDKAALQAELVNKNAEGIQGLTAGFAYAATQFAQTNTAFSAGQEAFSNTMSIMSSAISDFVDTGEFNFGKLAQSFAKMLADMAIKLAAQEALKAILGVGTAAAGAPNADAIMGLTSVGGGGGGGGGGGLFSLIGNLFGGFRAAGGPVSAGMAYTVGEQGPERFVPGMPGTIVPANSNENTGDVTVNVDMGTTSGASDPNQAMEFGRRVKAAVVDVIANEKRPGGTLYVRKSA